MHDRSELPNPKFSKIASNRHSYPKIDVVGSSQNKTQITAAIIQSFPLTSSNLTQACISSFIIVASQPFPTFPDRVLQIPTTASLLLSSSSPSLPPPDLIYERPLHSQTLYDSLHITVDFPITHNDLFRQYCASLSINSIELNSPCLR